MLRGLLLYALKEQVEGSQWQARFGAPPLDTALKIRPRPERCAKRHGEARIRFKVLRALSGRGHLYHIVTRGGTPLTSFSVLATGYLPGVPSGHNCITWL